MYENYSKNLMYLIMYVESSKEICLNPKKINVKRSFLTRVDFLGEKGATLPKIVINLSRTYEKLHCKGGPCRFSG